MIGIYKKSFYKNDKIKILFVAVPAAVQAQSSFVTPAPVPHIAYGLPVQHQQQHIHSVQQDMQLNHPLVPAHSQSNEQVQQIHQPASIYGAPASQQQQYTNAQSVHQFESIQVPSNQHEEQHQQIQQVHQVQQPTSVYGVPVPQQPQHVQAIQQFTPVVAQSTNPQQQQYEQFQQVSHQVQQTQQPSLVYGNPVQNHQQQVDHTHNASIDNEKLVFEAPIQSIEVSQSHLVENISNASESVNTDNDAVAVSAVGVKESTFGGYKYTQPTSSNGGYVY
jgi:hypothetical protein